MADASGGLAETAGKKVGPLPMGVWAAAIGGGLLIAFYANKNKGSSGPTISGSPTAESGIGAGAGGWNFQAPTDLPKTSTTTYTTNQEWGRAAINWLIGQNYSASLADAAIRNYIGGLQVTIQQQPLVDAALAHLGAPPQILNPVEGPAPDTPIPGPGGGGGPTNTPPPSHTPHGGLFGMFFDLLDTWLPGLSGNASGIHVPVFGQDYQVTGSYGNDKGTVTVVNPDGSTVTVNADPQATTVNNATTNPVPSTTGTRSYTVTQGDTLTSISIKMYGSALQQDKIYNANLSAIPDRDHLITGTVLNIPE